MTKSADTTSTGPGPALREARRRAGIEVADVAEALKVDAAIVLAIDQERHEDLPGSAFTQGYVRRYAELVGLDGEQMVARLDAVLPDAPPPQPVARTRRPPSFSNLFRQHAGVLYGSFVAVLVVAITVSVWIAWPSNVDPAGTVGPRFGPGETGSIAARTPAASDGASGDVSTGRSGESPLAGGDASADGEADALVDRLRFFIDEDSWVEVRDRKGDVLHADLQSAGRSLTVVGQPPFSIVVGYAPGVRLTFNDEPVALGPHTRDRQASLVLGH